MQTDTIAVVGAGVIGCAVAWALAREGRRVLLIDRDEPGRAGASFGNVGHIAAELVEPLPSPQLLLGFWRLLYAFGGPLQIPLHRLPRFLPWAARFAAAAFRREANTRALAPLVRPAASDYASALGEIGRSELLKMRGYYEIWLGPRARERARLEAAHMSALGVATSDVAAEALGTIASAARQTQIAGLWFPESAHVADPQLICRAFADAAVAKGGSLWRVLVKHMRARGDRIEIETDEGAISVATAVICAGPWSGPLLKPFGLHAPLEAARGYHVELPGRRALLDAPIAYVDRKLLVTPMTGRLRASSYMEFVDPEAPADPRKTARLRILLRQLGYDADDGNAGWVGARPVLPDYLPGIGRAPRHRVFYATGHQHIGLTLAPVTGALIADLVAERTPRHDVTAFDLQRFGSTTS